MKKMIFVTVLVLLVGSLLALPENTGKKKGCYTQVEKFMADYYMDYNQYTQDAGTIDLMDKYWAPEFIAITFLPLPEYPVLDLPAWKNFLIGVHLGMIETLTLDELSIDTKKLTAAARINIEFHDRMTGDLILNIDGIAFYNLKIEKKHKLKMTCLKLYVSDPEALMQISGPPPGF